jgi:hypothetical protein
VFPNANESNTDYGYIRYRDDANNAGGSNNRTRFEIGIENVTPGINSNDHLVLNKNGGRVGIGIIDPAYTLDVSGNGRFTGETIIGGNLGIGTTAPNYTLDVSGNGEITGTMYCNNYDRSNTASGLLIGNTITGGTNHVIRIGENITTGSIAIGNGNSQNGTISIGSSGNSARTITIGSGAATASSPIILNGNVSLNRPLTLPTTYVAPTSGQLGYKFRSSQVSTIAISSETVPGTISISTAGVYSVTFAVQIQLKGNGDPVFAYISIDNKSFGVGYYYGQSDPYYQGINGTYYVTTSGSYTQSVTVVINPVSQARVARVYLDYSYIRIA